MKIISICFLCMSTFSSIGQSSSDTTNSWNKKPTLELSGFIDAFYVYDFNQPQSAKRQAFLFNHNRHNEFNINLAFLKFALSHEKYRANLALHAGTYSNDNYAAEPGVLKNIFEATIGLALDKKNKLWLDAGIMPSHIGFESAISSDNMNLTRSLLAENSPYFLAGAKLTYAPNDKIELAGLVVNGWQRIQRLNGNSMLSFGSQLKYTPTEKVTINWSTFIGTDDPDSLRRMRYFSNLYSQINFTENVAFIAGFDVGMQQKFKNSTEQNIWLSPVIIAQFTLNNHWKTAIRGEYYEDKAGVIIPTGTFNGFMTSGVSVNVDYAPTENILCRLEGRWLNSKDKIFESNASTFSNNNFILGASIAIKFAQTLKNN